MKKVLLFTCATIAAAMLSCGSKAANGTAGDADSAAVAESAATTDTQASDSVAAAPETAEAQSGKGAEMWDVSVRTFDMDSQPKYEVTIRDSEGKTRTVGEREGFDYPQDMLKTFGNVWQVDANFDGHTDVLIALGLEPVSDQVFKRYDAWIYDTEDGKFYSQGTFRDICNPEMDPEENRVLGYYIARDGETKVYSAYYWQRDGNIVQEGESWTK